MEGEGLLSWSGRGEVTADGALCWTPCLSPRAPGGPCALSTSTEHVCVGDGLAEGTEGGGAGVTWAIRVLEDPNAPPLSYQNEQRAAAPSCRGLKMRAEERPCSLNLDVCIVLQSICVHAWE